MISSKYLKAYTVLIVLFLGILVGCKEKVEEPSEPDLSSVKEISLVEADLNTLFGDVDNFIDSGSIISFGQIIRKDSAVNGYTKYIELQYNGTAEKNIVRTGTVKCFVSGSRKGNDYHDLVVFENTSIQNRPITGSYTTTKIAAKDDSWTFRFNSKLTSENANGKIQYESNGTKIKTGIKTTGDSSSFKDDIWYNTDTASVQNRGQVFSVVSTSPLIIKAGCSYHYPVKGVQDYFNASQNLTYRIKFGDGGCDSYATYLNEKGKQYNFFIE